MDSLLDFSGKSALITGAASGFGRELALALAQRGAGLCLADYNEAGLADTCGEAEKLGAKVVSLSGDVADEAHAEALVKTAVDAFGKLDIAVNNAGIAPMLGPITQLDADTLSRQLDVNTKGVAFGMKHQLRVMAAQKDGAILNVSSMAGLGGAPMGSSYGAAKHAVIGLTKTAAVEFGGMNVRINAICPFFSQTPMVDNPHLNPNNNIEEVNKNLARGCPMKRIARVEEIVNVMVMMLSPGNTYMNGIAVPVDGGMSAM
ncbi:MAG: SDR family oxidoreductase [Salinisphaeraceae bacterium]|nr:SDR family oxidoreductase [Salinisphaeraceae bacterium]